MPQPPPQKTPFTFTPLLTILLLTLLTIPTTSQTPNTTIPLNTPQKYNQSQSQTKYYQTTISNPTSKQVLLITITADIQAYIGIFVSTSNSENWDSNVWPDWESYTQECFYASIDTCALRLPDVKDLPSGNTNLIVYFTVTVGADCQYTLDVQIQNIYPVKTGGKYTITFNNIQSTIVQLPGSNFLTKSGTPVEQIVIQCIYYSYRDLGHFQLYAQQGVIPTDAYVYSKSLNAFTQILELDPPSSLNNSYFIVLEGENSTRFNITIQQIQSLTNPTLTLNQTFSYLSKKQITYTYHSLLTSVTPTTIFKQLVLDIYQYRGYGKFYINYCNGLHNFTFQSIGGQGGQFTITPLMRRQCYEKVTTDGGLLVQNLQVSIQNVVFQIGYTIGLYQGMYTNYLSTNMKQQGILQNINQTDIYDIASYGNQTNLTLLSQVYNNNITISIYQCTRNSSTDISCQEIDSVNLTESGKPIGKISFVCGYRLSCQVRVTQTVVPGINPNTYARYSLLLSFTNKKSTQLTLNSPSFDIVQMNSYNYYYINVTALRNNPDYQFSNITVLNIKNTIVNGQVILLSSTTIQYPNYTDMFKSDNDIQYVWQGTITYIANMSYPEYIYISVLGDSQCIYHLQYTLNTTPNIPAAYQNLIDDAQNDFILTQNTPYILLKYVSHIIPYTITFNPTPNCIRYGNKLPIQNTQCMSPNSIPNQFTDSVLYFNISENNIAKGGVYKFGVYVGSGEYALQEDQPMLIACEKECYEIVTVNVLTSSANILHTGDGHIMIVGSNTTVSNGPLLLPCLTKSCTYKLNATMKWGGSMQLAFESTSASQITWRTKPITLPQIPTYKHFYFQLPHYTTFTSLIFYTQAADLTIYYNILPLNQKYTNTINYTYPNSTSYMGISYGDPLQQIHIVDLDQDIVNGYKCREMRIVCIVTISVRLNVDVQYSWQFVQEGYLYYSANTYQYTIQQDQPILALKQSYSISYFTHKINFAQEQTLFPYTIHIQPISNCRPQIQIQSTNYIKNYYTDITLPRVMPGQSTVNFRVIANQVCMYSVGLTNVGYQLMFAGVTIDLEVNRDKGEAIGVYQHSSWQDQFTVISKYQLSMIIVSKVQYTTTQKGQPVLILPDLNNNIGYCSNCQTLKITPTQNTQYLILIQPSIISSYFRPTLPITITLPQKPITLLHNQQQTYTYDPSDNSISAQNNTTVEYQYYSTNNFYIFVEVNRIQVKLVVRDANVQGQDGQILTIYISNSSAPWVFVDGGNDDDNANTDPQNTNNHKGLNIMIHYKITCQFIGQLPSGSKSTLKLHIQQVGVAGLIQLYEGVSIYDAFVHQNAMNCYKFVTPLMLGQDLLDIDINFMKNIKQFQQQTKSAVQAISSIVGTQTPLLPKLSKISPTSYRLTLQYYSAKTYKICFILTSPYMIGIQYSIIPNSPSMPMLYNNQYFDASAVYLDQYQMFEYINYYGSINVALGQAPVYYDDQNDVDIVMNVVNCVGESVILGSSSYENMITGKMTDISTVWSNDGVSSVLVDVPHGYYYFGVKPLNAGAEQYFRINIQQAPKLNNKTVIPNSLYSINWNQKASITQTSKDNTAYVIIKIPPVIRVKSVPDGTKLPIYNPVKIVYSLYLLTIIGNTTQKHITNSYKYSIDAYTRCPILLNYTTTNNTNNSKQKDNNVLKPTQIVTVQQPYARGISNDMIQFSLTVQQFKKQSNISIKAEVFLVDGNVSTNVLEYFYGQEEILVLDDSVSVWTPLKWIFVVFVILSCFGGVAVIYKFYILRRQRNISFEQSDMTAGQEMTTRQQPAPVEPTLADPQNPNIRKSLNNNVGYGEFIDEV